MLSCHANGRGVAMSSGIGLKLRKIAGSSLPAMEIPDIRGGYPFPEWLVFRSQRLIGSQRRRLADSLDVWSHTYGCFLSVVRGVF